MFNIAQFFNVLAPAVCFILALPAVISILSKIEQR